MVTAKLPHYYVFRVTSVKPLMVECSKWEDDSDTPEVVYKIDYENPSLTGGCSCPAWKRNCKHLKCIEEAIADGRIGELYKWRWAEKTGWQTIDLGNTDMEL